jgi:uncharacterized protein (DUF58 family)
MLFPFEKGQPSRVNKLAFSVYSAASIIYLLRRQRDAVGLSLFSDDIEFHTQARLSSVHIDLLYNQLGSLLRQEQAQLHKKTNAVDALHMIAENIHKRSLVVLFSDLIEQENMDQLFEALQHLKYNKHEVLLFHVADHRQERAFDFRNQPYRFVDLETGEHLRFSPNDLKKNYEKVMSDYFEEMRVRCGQYQIDLAEADINKDFKHVLYTYLLKRKRLF